VSGKGIVMTGRTLLTVEQVAERLQVHPETVRRWLRGGRLKGVRLGGSKLGYRISEDELARFIAASGSDQGDGGGKARAA
jgi:excisionase family DNA binding protein